VLTGRDGKGSACFCRGRLPVSSLSTVEGNPYASISTVEIRKIDMPHFMVRVELFGAGAEEYERLHANMDAMGIEREVVFTGGVRHQMPAGTYFGSSALGATAVRDKVQRFANPLFPHREAAIFVCEAKDNQWSAFLYPA
jgi:hypothetical protein